MKKSVLVHVIWAVFTVIAFTVGSKRFAAGDSGGSGDGTVASGSRYAERMSEGRDDGSRKKRAARRMDGASDSGGRNVVDSGMIRLTADDILELGEVYKTSRDPIERRLAFSKMIQGLTAENAMLLREQIEHISSNSSEWREFHYAWGALAGEVAVKFGAESERRDVAACFSGWASADPEAALAWLANQPEDQRGRGDFKWGAVYGLANNDPKLATDYVSERLEAGDRDAARMIRVVADSVMRSGRIGEATSWSESLPEGALRDVAVDRVARRYADEDPVRAYAWLEKLPGGPGKVRGIQETFERWAVRDAVAAAAKLNGMGDSPLRDSAVKGFSQRLADRDPATAIDWASTISNERVRNDALLEYGRKYMRRDRDAATRWLSNSDLPDSLRKRISDSGRRR